MKALLALVPLLAGATTADYPGERIVHYPLVHQVMCDRVAGTAFRISKTHFFTASHVSSNSGCRIGGKAITVTQNAGDLDVAEISVPMPSDQAFKVNCGGFIPGHWYFAVGNARGEKRQTMVTVYATYAMWPRNGERVLIGPETFIPGMSGGPVLDEQGEVVGVVNMLVNGTPISLSRELKETVLCSRARS